jgi:ribosome-associated translation inhibitor RaiA
MTAGVQVIFKGLDRSDAIEARVREEVERLERFAPRLMSSRIVIEKTGHKTQGAVYKVRIRLHLPGGREVAITRGDKDHAHEDCHVAIHDAFWTAGRRLQDEVRKQRRDVKRLRRE